MIDFSSVQEKADPLEMYLCNESPRYLQKEFLTEKQKNKNLCAEPICIDIKTKINDSEINTINKNTHDT